MAMNMDQMNRSQTDRIALSKSLCLFSMGVEAADDPVALALTLSNSH